MAADHNTEDKLLKQALELFPEGTVGRWQSIAFHMMKKLDAQMVDGSGIPQRPPHILFSPGGVFSTTPQQEHSKTADGPDTNPQIPQPWGYSPVGFSGAHGYVGIPQRPPHIFFPPGGVFFTTPQQEHSKTADGLDTNPQIPVAWGYSPVGFFGAHGSFGIPQWPPHIFFPPGGVFFTTPQQEHSKTADGLDTNPQIPVAWGYSPVGFFGAHGSFGIPQWPPHIFFPLGGVFFTTSLQKPSKTAVDPKIPLPWGYSPVGLSGTSCQEHSQIRMTDGSADENSSLGGTPCQQDSLAERQLLIFEKVIKSMVEAQDSQLKWLTHLHRAMEERLGSTVSIPIPRSE